MQKYKDAVLYIIFMIMAFAYVIFKMQPTVVELISVEKDISTKTTELADSERKLETLKTGAIEKQVKIAGQTKKIFRPEISGLDAEGASTVLFDDIIEMAKYNGIKFYSVEYIYNPPEDEFVKGAAAKYNVCQVNMQMIADYSDLSSFLKDIYKYPYLLNIDKIELVPYPKNKKILMINMQLKLYTEK